MQNLHHMSRNRITYRKLRKYKYQLISDYTTTIPLKKNAGIDYVILNETGTILIKQKYAWDGPSGPTIDTKNFMRGSLVHDALYQLIREGKLNDKEDRKVADQILRDICREDGMSSIRAAIVYRGVRWFGKSSAKYDDTEDKIHHAPK